MGIGTWQLVILLVIVLLLFGPKSLPKLGRMLGSGMREFKNALNNVTELDDEEKKKETESTTESSPEENKEKVSSSEDDKA